MQPHPLRLQRRTRIPPTVFQHPFLPFNYHAFELRGAEKDIENCVASCKPLPATNRDRRRIPVLPSLSNCPVLFLAYDVANKQGGCCVC